MFNDFRFFTPLRCVQNDKVSGQLRLEQPTDNSQLITDRL